MPLYEYRCEGCGQQFEVMQKFTDQPLTTHDACGGNVHRLLSAPALQFKGSGWYITDYAKGSNSSASSSSNKAESSAASNSSESSSKTPASASPSPSDSK